MSPISPISTLLTVYPVKSITNGSFSEDLGEVSSLFDATSHVRDRTRNTTCCITSVTDDFVGQFVSDQCLSSTGSNERCCSYGPESDSRVHDNFPIQLDPSARTCDSDIHFVAWYKSLPGSSFIVADCWKIDTHDKFTGLKYVPSRSSAELSH